MADKLRNSQAGDLSRVVALLDEHADDLGDFMAFDEKGKHLPAFLKSLLAQLGNEQESILG